ncbi:Acyl-CoA-binding domain-containing protein 1 [Ancistrocladus abbreviatus]
MGGDWQQLIQSVFIGLVFSFLLAKLISFVTAFKEDNLLLSRASENPPRNPQLHPGSAVRYDKVGLGPGLPKLGSVDSLADYNDVASRVSDDNSVLAEKGSIAGPDCMLDDVSDDDWEGVESTELDEAFSAATAFVAASAADKLAHKVPNEVQLQLYGLYKIATEGPCSAPPPPAFKMTARAKWQAWQKLGAMPPEDAMQKYVEIVTELFPSWASGAADKHRGDADLRSSDSSGPMGPVFSSFVYEEESGTDLKMDATHAFAREGDVENLLKCIENGVSVNIKDSEGRTPLHWAVDRGHLSVIELLITRKADVNIKDNDGQTPLHYAVVCDRESIAEYLVKHSADANIKDNDGCSPRDLCEKNWPWMQQVEGEVTEVE